jgi:ribosomal protein S18 acetylase RimI-like enzyme
MSEVTISPARDGDLADILRGFVAPTGDGYIHFVAVREDARGLGLGRPRCLHN